MPYIINLWLLRGGQQLEYTIKLEYLLRTLHHTTLLKYKVNQFEMKYKKLCRPISVSLAISCSLMSDQNRSMIVFRLSLK